MSPLMQAAVFLIDTLLSLYMVIILLRILLQWVRADFYNPICQWVLSASNFFILRLRRFIPAYYGIDWASVLLLCALAFIKQALLITLQTGIWVSGLGLLLLAIADILSLMFYIYLFATLAIVVTSWLNPSTFNPIVQIALKLVATPLAFIRRHLPAMGGFDLSPMVFTLILILFNILIVQVIAQQGIALILANQ